jgi:hypothetical protein
MLSPPFLGAAPSDDASNPLAQSLSSGMEFMKNLWGQMPSGVPGFVVPSVDLEELDKRIADLKAVEGWLELNANMLKATIQGLQVQRSTVATLTAMGQQGGGLNQMMQELQRSQAQASFAAPSVTSAAEFGHANWPMSTANSAAGSAAHLAAKPAERESAGSPYQASMPFDSGVSLEPEKKPPAKKAAAKARTGRRESVEPQSSDAVNSAAMASANIWMNFLKEQFSQIAGAATRSTEVVSKAPAKAATASPAAARAAKGAKARAGSKKQSKRRAAAKRVLAPRR